MDLEPYTNNELLRRTLPMVAPGTELRDGLERILRGRTGALIVLGNDERVEAMCSGGFHLNVPFSATRLRELAKMDGAVVITADLSKIVRAAAQLLPDSSIETTESGTRHRTAERVSKQTGFPVVSVSQSMRLIALYTGAGRYVLEESEKLVSRGNQAIDTLERYHERLEEIRGTLDALEIEDLVTVRDIALYTQRLEMVRRITNEIEGYVNELGVDGRLLALQLAELDTDVSIDHSLVIQDYVNIDEQGRSVDDVLSRLAELTSTQLVDLTAVASAMGLPGVPEMDTQLTPRGYRLLHRIPRIPSVIVKRVTENFDSLQLILAAGIDQLMQVDGVGEQRARNIREGLSRLAEISIVEGH